MIYLSTIAKTINEKNCIIPFVHKGKTYHDCITVDQDKPWCYVDRAFSKWEHCKSPPGKLDISKENFTFLLLL